MLRVREAADAVDGSDQDPAIGVVGIGRMGAPILAALSEAGFRTLAHDIDPARSEVVRAAGSTWLSTSDELIRSVDILITVLPGARETEEFLGGGALAAMRPEGIWLDLSSGDPRVTASIAARAVAHRIHSVSAPMGGSVGDVRGRTLTFFVGGDERAVLRVAPVLRTLAGADGLRVVSPRPEDAQSLKLIANAIWSANVLAATEALLLARALGIDPSVALPALSNSAAGSVAMTKHLPRLLEGDYLETFGLDRLVDEFDVVGELARRSGTRTDVLDLAAGLHRDALAQYGPVLGELLGARLLEDESGSPLR